MDRTARRAKSREQKMLQARNKQQTQKEKPQQQQTQPPDPFDPFFPVSFNSLEMGEKSNDFDSNHGNKNHFDELSCPPSSAPQKSSLNRNMANLPPQPLNNSHFGDGDIRLEKGGFQTSLTQTYGNMSSASSTASTEIFDNRINSVLENRIKQRSINQRASSQSTPAPTPLEKRLEQKKLEGQQQSQIEEWEQPKRFNQYPSQTMKYKGLDEEFPSASTPMTASTSASSSPSPITPLSYTQPRKSRVNSLQSRRLFEEEDEFAPDLTKTSTNASTLAQRRITPTRQRFGNPPESQANLKMEDKPRASTPQALRRTSPLKQRRGTSLVSPRKEIDPDRGMGSGPISPRSSLLDSSQESSQRTRARSSPPPILRRPSPVKERARSPLSPRVSFSSDVDVLVLGDEESKGSDTEEEPGEIRSDKKIENSPPDDPLFRTRQHAEEAKTRNGKSEQGPDVFGDPPLSMPPSPTKKFGSGTGWGRVSREEDFSEPDFSEEDVEKKEERPDMNNTSTWSYDSVLSDTPSTSDVRAARMRRLKGKQNEDNPSTLKADEVADASLNTPPDEFGSSVKQLTKSEEEAAWFPVDSWSEKPNFAVEEKKSDNDVDIPKKENENAAHTEQIRSLNVVSAPVKKRELKRPQIMSLDPYNKEESEYESALAMINALTNSHGDNSNIGVNAEGGNIRGVSSVGDHDNDIFSDPENWQKSERQASAAVEPPSSPGGDSYNSWKNAEEEWNSALKGEMTYHSDAEKLEAKRKDVDKGEIAAYASPHEAWELGKPNSKRSASLPPTSHSQRTRGAHMHGPTQDATTPVKSDDDSLFSFSDEDKQQATKKDVEGRETPSMWTTKVPLKQTSHKSDKIGSHDLRQDPNLVPSTPEMNEMKEEARNEKLAKAPSRRRARSARKSRRSFEGNFKDDSSEDDEDETGDGVSTLQDRAQQAWSARNKHFAANGGQQSRAMKQKHRSLSAPPSQRDSNSLPLEKSEAAKANDDAPTNKGKSMGVAFVADEDNTVYHIASPEPSDSDSSTEVTQNSNIKSPTRTDDEASTLHDEASTTRSYNSTYTKSTESEVGDETKGFLFMGNSASNSPRKKQVKKFVEDDVPSEEDKDDQTWDSRTKTTDDERTKISDDEETYEGAYDTEGEGRSVFSLDDDTKEDRSRAIGASSSMDSDADQKSNATSKHNANSACGKDGDPVSMMWGMVEAVSSAFGMPQTAGEDKMIKEEDAESNVVSLSESGTPDTKTRGSTAKDDEDEDAEEGWIDYASKLVFPSVVDKTGGAEEGESVIPISIDGGEESDCSDHSLGHYKESYDTESDSKLVRSVESSINETVSETVSAETDDGLVSAAQCAAESKHIIHGVEYDGTEVDVVNEIQFSVITVGLPLGLVFKENVGGCWVTQVFQSGNAATNARGGGVEIGDQLAAINGKNTARMNVAEVRNLINDSPNPDEIELTFLRYVGPLRPKAGIPSIFKKNLQAVKRQDVSPMVDLQRDPLQEKMQEEKPSTNQSKPLDDSREQSSGEMKKISNGKEAQGSKNQTPVQLENSEQKVEEKSPLKSQAQSNSKPKKRFKVFGRSKKSKAAT